MAIIYSIYQWINSFLAFSQKLMTFELVVVKTRRIVKCVLHTTLLSVSTWFTPAIILLLLLLSWRNNKYHGDDDHQTKQSIWVGIIIILVDLHRWFGLGPQFNATNIFFCYCCVAECVWFAYSIQKHSISWIPSPIKSSHQPILYIYKQK